MNIQVLGHNGMLGSAVCKAIQQRGHRVWTVNTNIETMLNAHVVAPVVINCAGLVKQRQEQASRFMAVNAVGPHRLAEACDAVGARLIHVSTDCVFDHGGPHDEDATPDAHDMYARSKLAGEVYTIPHLTVRTSFVGFGIRGLIADLQGVLPVRASQRLLWSGHTVDTVADALITLAERSDISGLLHMPGEFQNRLQLCERLKARFDLPAPLEQNNYPGDRRLISGLWQFYGLPEFPSFAAQLEAMHV